MCGRLGLIHYKYPYDLLKGKIRAFFGHIPEDGWTAELFPESDTARRRAYTRWERMVLAGHLVIAVAGGLGGVLGCPASDHVSKDVRSVAPVSV